MNFNAYLSFDGRCEEAFQFYAKVLRGNITAMFPHEGTPAEAYVPAEWKKKIMHAALQWGNGTLMGADTPMGQYSKPVGICVNIAVNKGDTGEADRIFAELSEGGSVQMPIQETFWAKRFGMFTDKFGIPWMINCE